MLGGGTFTAQNKILNGAYINFVSASKASASLSDRGIATMPLELDWGVDNAIFEVSPADFQKNSLKIFGYPFTRNQDGHGRRAGNCGIRQNSSLRLCDRNALTRGKQGVPQRQSRSGSVHVRHLLRDRCFSRNFGECSLEL